MVSKRYYCLSQFIIQLYLLSWHIFKVWKPKSPNKRFFCFTIHLCLKHSEITFRATSTLKPSHQYATQMYLLNVLQIKCIFISLCEACLQGYAFQWLFYAVFLFNVKLNETPLHERDCSTKAKWHNSGLVQSLNQTTSGRTFISQFQTCMWEKGHGAIVTQRVYILITNQGVTLDGIKELHVGKNIYENKTSNLYSYRILWYNRGYSFT